MDMVFVHLMCSDPEFDSHRLRDVLDAAIESGICERMGVEEREKASCKGEESGHIESNEYASETCWLEQCARRAFEGMKP